MKVASIINYKGGVGKTTLTANIGAEIARQGRRVLLLDVDPQASLTLSFYRPEEWRTTLAPQRTIRHWYEARRPAGRRVSLVPFVTVPEAADFYVRAGGGQLGLVASDLMLGDVEERLAIEIGKAAAYRSREKYLRVIRRLGEALETVRDEAYDFVLIDCPPNFGIITRSAIAASDGVIVPARPEVLSTFAVDHLKLRLDEFRRQLHSAAGTGNVEQGSADGLAPHLLGVIFTMVRYARAGQLIPTFQNFVDQTRGRVATFDAMLRESHTYYASAPQRCVPAVLSERLGPDIEQELRLLVNEFMRKIGAIPRG